MGAFDTKDDVIVIRDKKNWDAHEQVEARTLVRVSDEEWVQNQLVLIRNSQKNQRSRGGLQQQKSDVEFQAQIGAAKRLWVFRMLKSWTFTKDGMPMVLSNEAVRQLPQSYLDYIYDAIMAAQPKDEDETTEQGEDDGEMDPTTSAVLTSIAGDAGREDLLVQELVSSSKSTGNRNFLNQQ